MTKNQRKNPFTVYRSYSFIDKDPIIDRIHTMIDDQHVTYKKVAEESGISAGTLYQWIGGTTRRPQFCTVVAVIRALGYDVQVTEQRGRQKTNGIVVQPARTMIKLYALDASNQVIEADLRLWGSQMEYDADRRVGFTQITSAVQVSTVFLGIDHRYGLRKGPPLVFESMVFGGPEDGHCQCYASWDDASTGHAALVRKLRSKQKNKGTVMRPAYFRITDHTQRRTQTVEVLDGDGKLIAVIYPHERGLHIVSKHLGMHVNMVGADIPSMLVCLDQEGRW